MTDAPCTPMPVAPPSIGGGPIHAPTPGEPHCLQDVGGTYIDGGEGNDRIIITGDQSGERVTVLGGPGHDRITLDGPKTSGIVHQAQDGRPVNQARTPVLGAGTIILLAVVVATLVGYVVRQAAK